jgi:hypothetical protein
MCVPPGGETPTIGQPEAPQPGDAPVPPVPPTPENIQTPPIVPAPESPALEMPTPPEMPTEPNFQPIPGETLPPAESALPMLQVPHATYSSYEYESPASAQGTQTRRW